MMKIVIDIPDKIYDTFQRGNWSVTYDGKKIRDIVMNGTPLPKGHGRLKDVDAFISKVKSDRAHSAYLRSWTADDVLDALNNSYAPTIIKADKRRYRQ